MPDKNRPLSNQEAPDPSRSYERAQPDAESGMGRLDNNTGTPQRTPDKVDQAVKHKQDNRQINAQDVVNEREEEPAPKQPDHSMKDEEPMGWDQAPTDIKNPRAKRQPRTEGKGGTP